MIKARTRYVIVGGDFSAQEPRLLTSLCKDEKLTENWLNNRDIYATIMSNIKHIDYWESMEHWEDGTPNPSGKKIRKQGKGIVLGISYGMGAKLLASILGVSIDECKVILDDFDKMFPGVKTFMDSNAEKLRRLGYVEDYMGRRRRLPHFNDKELVFKAYTKVQTSKDVFINSEQIPDVMLYDKDKSDEFQNRFDNDKMSSFKKKQKYKEMAKACGIETQDNGAFISSASTQCKNSPIQASAASLTKKAMGRIFKDKQMNDWNFRMLIPIHDEILGECPVMYADEVANRLSEIMIDSAKPECTVPMKVDAYIVKRWYADEVSNELRKEFLSRKSAYPDESDSSIIAEIKKDYPELSDEPFRQMCLGEYDLLSEEI